MMNKVFKKIAIVAAAAAMTLTAVAPSAFASAAPVEETALVKVESYTEIRPIAKSVSYTVRACSGIYYVSNNIGLNVRQKPTQNSARLGGLQKGARVQVTGKVYVNGKFTGWVRINYNGQKAYVRNCLSTAKPAAQTTKTAVTNKKAYTVKVSKNYLALRSKPINARTYEKAHLKTGTKVIVLNKNNAAFWYVYVPAMNQYGYVNHSFLV